VLFVVPQGQNGGYYPPTGHSGETTPVDTHKLIFCVKQIFCPNGPYGVRLCVTVRGTGSWGGRSLGSSEMRCKTLKSAQR